MQSGCGAHYAMGTASLSLKVKQPEIEVDNCLLVSTLKVKLNYTLSPYLHVLGAQGHMYLYL
jgi:hypothetical protein